MGQGRRHFHLCHALYQMLRAVCVPEHTVGADQFVYFDAAAPKRCLAPDAFVTLGVRDHDFDSYLVWEEGTPDVAFEVLSPSDTPERWTFEEKLRRYHALGVRELVTFHVDAPEGERLRIWDRLEQDLVEREVTGDTSPCVTLGLTLLIGPVDQYPTCLRLARDPEGRELVLTTDEQRLAAEAALRLAQREREGADQERESAESARRSAESAQKSAEARVRELEAKLAAARPKRKR